MGTERRRGHLRRWRTLTITIGAILSAYVLFLLYANINLTPKREYVFYDALRIGSRTVRIDSRIIKGAEPIFIAKSPEKAVLLLHGMGGTPVEMRELAEYLAGRGISVLVPLLSSHGREYRDIGNMDGDRLYDECREYLAMLKEEYRDVYVGGLSTGGSLSLKIGELQDVAGVISLASPITYGFDFLGQSTLYLFRFFSRITPSLRRIEHGLAKDPRVADILPSFDRLPVKVALEGEYLKDEVKENLAKIREPILILQSTFDNRAAPSSAQYIYDHVSSDRKEIVWLKNSGHVITMDYDKDIVFRKIYDFVMAN